MNQRDDLKTNKGIIRKSFGQLRNNMVYRVSK